MRYLNELILTGRVKRVSLLLAIPIDFDLFFSFSFFGGGGVGGWVGVWGLGWWMMGIGPIKHPTSRTSF